MRKLKLSNARKFKHLAITVFVACHSIHYFLLIKMEGTMLAGQTSYDRGLLLVLINMMTLLTILRDKLINTPFTVALAIAKSTISYASLSISIINDASNSPI